VPGYPSTGNPLTEVLLAAVRQANRQEGQATSGVLYSPTATQEEDGRVLPSSGGEGARRRVNRAGEYVAVSRIPRGFRVPVPSPSVPVPPSSVPVPPSSVLVPLSSVLVPS
jgi:hypothetical protein